VGRSSDVLWHLCRAAGVTAYVALTLAIVFGLLLSTSLAARWITAARGAELHRWLSSVTLALAGAHAAVLLGDRLARFSIVSVLVPFAAPTRPFAVGLGVLALYAALALHASFSLRGRIGVRAWRALHYTSFAVYALVTAHGLLAGSDASLPWMGAVYLASVTLVTALTGYRVIWAVLGRDVKGARSAVKR
jgi:methionine sulfoxide reductase heme-binding subunit